MFYKDIVNKRLSHSTGQRNHWNKTESTETNSQGNVGFDEAAKVMIFIHKTVLG